MTQAALSGFFTGLERALHAVEFSDATGQPWGWGEGMGRALDLLLHTGSAGRKVMFIGNGASATIASHQALDYTKAAGIRAVAFNDPALLTCLGNDHGYAQVFARAVAMYADDGDTLVALSSSGQSDNIRRAAVEARTRRCRVITLSGFAPDNPLRTLGDVNVYVPVRNYGQAEVVHLALLHGLLDTIVGLGQGGHL